MSRKLVVCFWMVVLSFPQIEYTLNNKCSQVDTKASQSTPLLRYTTTKLITTQDMLNEQIEKVMTEILSDTIQSEHESLESQNQK